MENDLDRNDLPAMTLGVKDVSVRLGGVVALS
jgi:hypothetical protein